MRLLLLRCFHFPVLCGFLCALLPSLSAWSANAELNASLSTTNASVGEQIEYTLTIKGALRSDRVAFPEIDGIEVQQGGTSTAFGFSFGGNQGRSASSTTITYLLVPKRAGTFTIPPAEVLRDGQRLKTKSFTLTVTPGQPTAQAGDLAFAEFRLGKQSAFIGEALLVEVRIYLEMPHRANLTQKPIFSGNGFTTQPLAEYRGRRIVLADKEYAVMPLRTVITPGKAGKLTIGPLPVKLLLSKVVDRFGRMLLAPAQEIEVTAPAVELDVKPLPATGRPAAFSGAIGKFTFEGTGTPSRVNAGEPVQMKLTISGEGNFDRIGTPELADPKGWRVYDAEQKFSPTDDIPGEVGMSGSKTFSLPVAPLARKDKMPQFVFAFFNPETEKYETLTTAAAPLVVTGAVPKTEPDKTPSTDATTPAAPPTPAVAQPQDIFGILPQIGPAWTNRIGLSPWLLAVLVAAPLPILAGVLFWRARRDDPHALQVRALRDEKSALLQRVRHSKDRSEIYDAAARLLQIEAALVTNKSVPACELPDILAARRLTPETAQAVESLFLQRADLVYAGGSRNTDPVRDPERDRVLDVLATYERSSVQ